MTKKFFPLLLTTAFATVLGLKTSLAEGNGPITVDSVDLERYQGDWFSVATKRASFQRLCYGDTKANYTLAQDRSSILVKNSCTPYLGSLFGTTDVEGVASPVDSTNSILKVSIGGRKVPEPNYFVIGLDSLNYEWVVVTSNEFRFTWVLMRDPKRFYEFLPAMLTALRSNPIDLCDLRLEPQPGAPYEATQRLCRDPQVASKPSG